MPSEGERIKKLRKALNKMSQQEFADIFGVERSFISQVESNKSNLSKKHLSKLLLTHNVNINYILEGIGSMFLGSENSATGFNSNQITPELIEATRKVAREELILMMKDFRK
ncbi:MAG: helix-turn-helix transcriptional regulator [bacterium]